MFMLKKVATDCGSCASRWKLSCDIYYRFRVNHYILLISLPQGSFVIWLLQKGFILLDSLLQGGQHQKLDQGFESFLFSCRVALYKVVDCVPS